MGPANETNFIDNSDIQPCDVLLGRGTLCAFHVGSIAFKVAVASRLDAYLKMTSQKTKTRLTVDIMRSIRLAGGRFLSRNQGPKTVHQTGEAATIQWYEVNSNVARVKIRDVFRDCIKSMKKESRPSLLLDDLGLLGQFDHISTFSEIVKYVATSSRVREYTYIRNDLINERKKKRSAAILREEKQACGINDDSIVESAACSAVSFPSNSSTATIRPSYSDPRHTLLQDEQSIGPASSISPLSVFYAHPRKGHHIISSLHDDSETNHLVGDHSAATNVNLSCKHKLHFKVRRNGSTAKRTSRASFQQEEGRKLKDTATFGLSMHSSVARSRQFSMPSSTGPYPTFTGTNSHLSGAVPLRHFDSRKEPVWKDDGSTIKGSPMVEPIYGRDYFQLHPLPSSYGRIQQPFDDSLNDAIEKQAMSLLNIPSTGSEGQALVLPPASATTWVERKDAAASPLIHNACATRDEVLEKALLLSCESDDNALFDFCLDHWNDLECTVNLLTGEWQ